MPRQQQAPSTDIGEGDLVVALRDGAQVNGYPRVVPKKGSLYRVTSVYREWYGFGCTLEGLSPKPYKGFFLVNHGEHYFRKVIIDEQPADISFQELLRTGVGVGTPAKELEDA